MFVLELLIKVIVKVYNPLNKVFALWLIFQIDLDTLESLGNFITFFAPISHVSHVLRNFTRGGAVHRWSHLVGDRSWAKGASPIGDLNTFSLRKSLAQITNVIWRGEIYFIPSIILNGLLLSLELMLSKLHLSLFEIILGFCFLNMKGLNFKKLGFVYSCSLQFSLVKSLLNLKLSHFNLHLLLLLNCFHIS